jgi:DNA-binding MarR family transcriptional regulator
MTCSFPSIVRSEGAIYQRADLTAYADICQYAGAMVYYEQIVTSRLEKLILENNLDPAFCILRHVTRTSRIVVSAFDTALSPVGLTGHQFNLLVTLARSGPLNVNSLAAAVGMHPSTTPRLIAPLARRGLVRGRAGIDRRERLMFVTKKGCALLLRAFPKWAEVQSRIVSQLGDQEWLSEIDVLRNIRKSLREPREDLANRDRDQQMPSH